MSYLLVFMGTAFSDLVQGASLLFDTPSLWGSVLHIPGRPGFVGGAGPSWSLFAVVISAMGAIIWSLQRRLAARLPTDATQPVFDGPSGSDLDLRRKSTDEQVADFRFRIMGETAGLVIHDLTGPVHVINFCTQVLRSKYASALPGRHLEQLSGSVDRILAMIADLRTFLKSPEAETSPYGLDDVLRETMRMVEMQYFHYDFARIRTGLDTGGEALHPAIHRMQLQHVLYCALADRVSVLIRSDVLEPALTMTTRLAEDDPRYLEIVISDNGDDSSICTDSNHSESTVPVPWPPQIDVFGMTLSRRILATHGGSLAIQPKSEVGPDLVNSVIRIPVLPSGGSLGAG